MLVVEFLVNVKRPLVNTVIKYCIIIYEKKYSLKYNAGV